MRWPASVANSTATVGCHAFDARLRGGEVTRGCQSVGTGAAAWGDVNTQQCSFTSPTDPFLLMWMKLIGSSADDIEAARNQLIEEVIAII